MSTITLESPLGKKIHSLASQDSIKMCLEVGTADGTGSTYCLGKALKRTGGMLFTIEASDRVSQTAIKNLSPHHLPVLYLTGTALSSEYLKPWEFYEKEINGNKYLPSDLLPEMKVRYDQQKKYYYKMSAGSLIKLCRSFSFFDLVFLDGGTFTSYDEMLFLEDRITQYLILDDTNPHNGGRKNVKTRIELLNSKKWEVDDDNYDDRTGWMVLKKKK